ncbi:general transcription factor IIH subunit 1-like [Toxotes jaculatrix]|uniref:general transcription factor IIH subunit 1-like n=1 Tax=Toxotes jaculatrix TaxID=941984 RepID=UPI001B3A94BC|nr:general transcription factor IIH subunit 1-like [Toxotes jaculatrix]
MLKEVFVLGCLLSLALASPVDVAPKRLARSNSGSSSHEGRRPFLPYSPPNQQWFQLLLTLLQLQQALTTTPTTTTTTPTTTTTTATTTTTTTPATTK